VKGMAGCFIIITGLFKKKHAHLKIYFASTVEHMVMCYI
jgi:hypothetical protein